MQSFRVDSKTILPSNQCCHAVTKTIFGWFNCGWEFWERNPKPL